MKKITTIVFLIFVAFISNAQPYVDILNVRYTNAFNSANKGGTNFSHLYIGSDLPLKLKNNGYIVFSPFFENWDINDKAIKNPLPSVSSIAFATSAIIPLNKKHWSLTTTVIPRINSEGLNLKNGFQMGGALLANYKKNDQFKYKFGVYINDEFFGTFIIPLVGIDWRINTTNYLFGVLPGRMTYEHQLNTHFYTGVTFRSITNSYKLANGNYIRIEDNQLTGFIDYYATKHIVIISEAGFGIFRKLRGGIAANQYTTDYFWDDGFFIKLSASYRMRF